MRIIRYKENLLDECAAFWWTIYEHMPYVHRPDGHQTINTPPIGPAYFAKTLQEGFENASYWLGNAVTDDSVFLAADEGRMAGILVCSIDEEKRTGNILSAYVQRDHRGREIADALLSEALERFREQGLRRAVAAPCGSMEVECPIHLALLDAGFAWQNDWRPSCPEEEHGVFLGGSLEGFRLQPEISEKIEGLRQEGIEIEQVTADQLRNLRRLDTGENVSVAEDDWPGLGPVSYVALVNDCVVGWLPEVGTFEDEERIIGGVVPVVIPTYRRRGIGKTLYHLGIEEVVRQGAQYGWTATEIHNPARLIYHSVGFRYWYTCFSRMSKRLR